MLRAAFDILRGPLLAAALLSPALAQTSHTVDGKYCGRLFSSGELKEVVTRLTTGDTGQLSGSYEFADDGQLTQGTLRQDGLLRHRGGDITYTLVWTDKYGTGQLVIRFRADGYAFAGTWGFGDDEPSHQWDGARCDGNVARL